MARSMACAQLASYTTQAHMPRGGANHSGMGPPISVASQDSLPQI